LAGFDVVVSGRIVGYLDMIEVGFRDEIQALEKQTRTGSNYPRRVIINMNDPHLKASLEARRAGSILVISPRSAAGASHRGRRQSSCLEEWRGNNFCIISEYYDFHWIFSIPI
jgi:hypothetical protein